MSNHNKKGARRKGAVRAVDVQQARSWGLRRERIGNGTHHGWTITCSVGRADLPPPAPPCLGRIERQWGAYERLDSMVATLKGEGWSIASGSRPVCPRCSASLKRPPGCLPQAHGTREGGEGESHQEPYTSDRLDGTLDFEEGAPNFPGKGSEISAENAGEIGGSGSLDAKKNAGASPLQEPGLCLLGRCSVQGCPIGRATVDWRCCFSPAHPACLRKERVRERAIGSVGGPVGNPAIANDAGGQGGSDFGSANREDCMSEFVHAYGCPALAVPAGDCRCSQSDALDVSGPALDASKIVVTATGGGASPDFEDAFIEHRLDPGIVKLERTMSDHELAANMLSPAEGKRVHWHLQRYFDEDHRIYAEGWSDDRVSRACGVSRETIEIVRSEAYGKLAPDPRVEELEQELGHVLDEIANLQSRLSGLARDLEKLKAEGR